MVSLRFFNTSMKVGLKRDSKSEDKGLFFFKLVLRQKEIRRSIDFGKIILFFKKVSGSFVKSVCKNVMDDKVEKGYQVLGFQQSSVNVVGKEQFVFKDFVFVKYFLLFVRKFKFFQLDFGVFSFFGGRQFVEKFLKKLFFSM